MIEKSGIKKVFGEIRDLRNRLEPKGTPANAIKALRGKGELRVKGVPEAPPTDTTSENSVLNAADQGNSPETEDPKDKVPVSSDQSESSPENTGGRADKEANVATQYAQAAHAVDTMLDRGGRASLLSKETRKEGVRRLLDNALEDDKGLSADMERVKDFLVKTLAGVEVDSDKVSAAQNYITMKEQVDTDQVQRMSALTERMSGEDADENAVETAVEAITTFEQQLMEAEVRLRKQMNGDNKAVEKVKKLWGYLGDKNLGSFFEKKGWYRPKNTILGKIGYSALHAMSLRSAAMATLVPLAGFGFGAAGVGVAIGLRRGIGGVMGASGGHALVRRWLENNLKKRVDEVSQLENLEDADHEQVIHLKKEYDAFILEHRANTAEEVGGGEEYEKLQDMYRDAVKNFCNDADRVEKLRTRQNLSEVKARNIVRNKKNRGILFGSAFLGGAVSAVVAPKFFDMAHDFGAGLIDADADGSDPDSGKKTSQDTSTTKKVTNPRQTETTPSTVDDPSSQTEDLSSTETDGTNQKQATPESATPPEPYIADSNLEDPTVAENADADLTKAEGDAANRNPEKPTSSEGTDTDPAKAEEDPSRGSEDPTSAENTDASSAEMTEKPPASNEDVDTDSTETTEQEPTERTREFELVDGFYTVQEGDSLSKMWLAANGGDVEQMKAAMAALEGLEKGQLQDFGIDSGNIHLIRPDDKINIDAIQEWLKGEGVQADTVGGETPAQQSAETNDGFGYDSENKVLTINNAEKFDSGNLETILGVRDPLTGTSLPVTEDFKDFLANGVFEDGDQILLDEDAGVIRLLDAKGEVADEVQVFESEVVTEPAVEQKGGAEPPPQVAEDLALPKGVSTVEHEVRSGENTVAKVLMGRGYDINNVPEEILWKEVHEGHLMDIYLVEEDGQFLGVKVNGERLIDEYVLQRVIEPTMGGSAEADAETLTRPEGDIHQYSMPKNGTILKVLDSAGFTGNINNEEFMLGDEKVWKPCLVKISEPDAVWEIGSGERGKGFVEYQNILNKQWGGGNVTVTETEAAWVVEMTGVDPGSMDRNIFSPDLVDVTIRKGGVMKGLLDKIPDEYVTEKGAVLRMDGSSYSVLADDVVRYNPNFRFEEGLTAKTSPGEVFVDGYGDTDSVQQITMDKKILPEFKKLLEDSALREGDSSAVKLAKRVRVENFIDALTFGMTGDTLEEAREAMVNELIADNSEKLQDLYEKLGDINPKKGEYVELLYDGNSDELQFVGHTKDVEFVSGGRAGPKQASVSNSTPIASVNI